MIVPRTNLKFAHFVSALGWKLCQAKERGAVVAAHKSNRRS